MGRTSRPHNSSGCQRDQWSNSCHWQCPHASAWHDSSSFKCSCNFNQSIHLCSYNYFTPCNHDIPNVVLFTNISLSDFALSPLFQSFNSSRSLMSPFIPSDELSSSYVNTAFLSIHSSRHLNWLLVQWLNNSQQLFFSLFTALHVIPESS